MQAVLIILAAAVILGVLNAVRGSGHQWLRFVMGAAAGATALYQGSGYWLAAAQAIGVYVFMVQAWGRWYTFDHGERSWSGDPSWYEKIIERIGGSSDYACWAISASVFAVPLAVLVSPLWFLLGPLVPALYAMSWEMNFKNPITGGEAAAGALIGALAATAHLWHRSPTLSMLGLH
jgi:hypothetical protein